MGENVKNINYMGEEKAGKNFFIQFRMVDDDATRSRLLTKIYLMIYSTS
jgi:hypothetical protein